MSRAKTKEEMREEFLDHVRTTARYWATNPGSGDVKNRCSGVAFSILTMLDGCSMNLPAMDVVMRPHQDDEQFDKDEGSNWVPDGLVINDGVHLHEMFYEEERNRRGDNK